MEDGQIPIIDLFAGPGGLGEGFSAVVDASGRPAFRLALSIERDPIAHQTLSLRAIFRRLKATGSGAHYYDYVTGRLSKEDFFRLPRVVEAVAYAAEEALCAELGKAEPVDIDRRIRKAKKGANDWILIGGPPCQAYSIAGRSRRRNDSLFEKDEKHFLYREYLRIIVEHQPAVFVMENVKGLLSSTHSGKPIFLQILEDLSNPARGVGYEIRSFVCRDQGMGLSPSDYVIHSEQFGVPQKRHRVILLGVRRSPRMKDHGLLIPGQEVSVGKVLRGLPRLRSRLSRQGDDKESWTEVLSQAVQKSGKWKHPLRDCVLARMAEVLAKRRMPTSIGADFLPLVRQKNHLENEFSNWIHDAHLGGVIQHVSRSHMDRDLHRYLFAACYADVTQSSPKLRDFPDWLLPEHRNTQDDVVPFQDRFRVQVRGEPASTIVSHIAKDGHYYIHPDPSQCRSLTVREAARLQTFPDNYFFEGNRTQQYWQVGNAVPPYLALQIGRIVAQLLAR